MNFTEMLEEDRKVTLKEIHDKISSHIEDKQFYLTSVSIDDDKLLLDFMNKKETVDISVSVERANDDDTDLIESFTYEDLENDRALDHYNYTLDHYEPVLIESVLVDVCDEIDDWFKYYNKEGENK